MTPITAKHADLDDKLDERSRDIFRRIVESYLIEGEPVGSRNLSKMLPTSLSPASVRNVMSDLETLGLIYSPHVSAGRLPTEQGLRFFVDAFMDTGEVSDEERMLIESQLGAGEGHPHTEQLLTEASQMLSRVSNGAGLVLAAKRDGALKHIEFVRLEETKALAVLVWESGDVENRVIDLPAGMTASQLAEAANFLNHHARGQTLAGARDAINAKRREVRAELNELSASLVERGLAVWSGANDGQPRQLIVRGRANLLENLTDAEEIERTKMLLDDLERKEEIISVLDMAESGSGVRIFIGSENRLFSLSGSSLVVAPYRDGNRRVVGALGVLGPTRLNYARIVPMVDYTAQLVSRIIERE
ncbi:heat-inducible transcriptional repressor HrcA [Roseitalea porphyridii]|uniref:Heat-inducible transcription repressor HrcA n=1 Tax=Roseitalea porphyridii TaxID=1852022 RepID=A0A4V1A4D2_9HYPH|nr:heat-inducible transcriptional repressor HrcA [Roseitalea porphyridii]QBK32208.1 heat-inducible transcriptional repressor HrcA [Roseitalea porphyridii]